MPIGPALRERLGRFEEPAANAYRSWFIHLDDLAATLASVAAPSTILEIGCGPGYLSSALLGRFTEATLVGSDICERPGSNCAIGQDRAEFVRELSTDLVATRAASFDLVVVCDVLHHVPGPERVALLRSAGDLCRPGGLVAIKEWEPLRGYETSVATFADRYISGDRGATFLERAELDRSVAEAMPGADLVLEARVPPRRNNLLLIFRTPG